MDNESKQAREAKNAYFREYRQNNKSKIKEIQKRYWEKKAGSQEQKKIIQTTPETF